MFYNISSPDPDVHDQIVKLIGLPLHEGAQASMQFHIASASSEIYGMLDVTGGLPDCTVEKRDRGLLIHFRSEGLGMAWVIPFWRLHIQHNAGKLSLFVGEHLLRLENKDGTPVARSMIAELYEHIAKSTGQDHDIYGAVP